MNPPEEHHRQVENWLSSEVVDRMPLQQVQAFENVIERIQTRALLTLSSVTFNAILARILFESQEKFPIFLFAHVETLGLCFNDLATQAELSDRLIASFRFFLLELFSILENLTAGILTIALYQELLRSSVDVPTNGRKD